MPNFDPNDEERYLSWELHIPIPGVSDRVFAWRNWGKIIDNTLALDVGITTPKAIELLRKDSNLQGASTVVGSIIVSGLAMSRINDHACQITYISCADLKGYIPHKIVDILSLQTAKLLKDEYVAQFGPCEYGIERMTPNK